MRKTVFIVLSTLVVALGASAAELHDFYVIPVAAHVSGANGTSWRTDVAIQNIQFTPITIEMSVVESGEGLLDNIFPIGSTVTVPAGGSVILGDVLKDHRGQAESSGALLVGGDKPFALTSRTYNVTANGTLGQAVPASSDVAAEGSTLFIPGLISNAAFRTNIGLLMSATTPMTVIVAVNGADGQLLGKRVFSVAAGVTTHVQFGAPTLAPAPFDTAGGIVRIIEGSGTVVAYASVVDNATGDASYIAGGAGSAGPIAPLSLLLNRR
ncbi:MAG TPA: hypothetical protein VLV78_06290 [Thermoanaerobaculia bacterium]|nr:hypothetical protein [Thermoanaerobaculia bacterium]